MKGGKQKSHKELREKDNSQNAHRHKTGTSSVLWCVLIHNHMVCTV